MDLYDIPVGSTVTYRLWGEVGYDEYGEIPSEVDHPPLIETIQRSGESEWQAERLTGPSQARLLDGSPSARREPGQKTRAKLTWNGEVKDWVAAHRHYSGHPVAFDPQPDGTLLGCHETPLPELPTVLFRFSRSADQWQEVASGVMPQLHCTDGAGWRLKVEGAKEPNEVAVSVSSMLTSSADMRVTFSSAGSFWALRFGTARDFRSFRRKLNSAQAQQIAGRR